MARDHARLHSDFEVVGGYLSPVSDQYKKPGLAPGAHRFNMCQMACKQESDWLSVDPWEVLQPAYSKTADVLDHFKDELNNKHQGVEVLEEPGQRRPVRIMLLAGSDLIQTMSEPDVWAVKDVRSFLYTSISRVSNKGCDLSSSLYSCRALTAAPHSWRLWLLHHRTRRVRDRPVHLLILFRALSKPAGALRQQHLHGVSAHPQRRLFDQSATLLEEGHERHVPHPARRRAIHSAARPLPGSLSRRAWHRRGSSGILIGVGVNFDQAKISTPDACLRRGRSSSIQRGFHTASTIAFGAEQQRRRRRLGRRLRADAGGGLNPLWTKLLSRSLFSYLTSLLSFRVFCSSRSLALFPHCTQTTASILRWLRQ